MIVKELIEILKKLDQNRVIEIQNRDGDIFTYNIDSVITAYEDSGNIIVKYNNVLHEDDLEDLSKENLRFIVLNDPVYVIQPK